MHVILALSLAIHGCYVGSKMVVSLYALHLGANQAVVGVIAMLYAVVPLVLGVFVGRMADTLGMRMLTLSGSVCIGIALVAGWYGGSLTALFILAVLVGSGFLLCNVCIQNLTGGWGGPEDRARNFSILSIGYSVSSFAAPMIMGFTIDLAGHGAALLVLAAFTLLPVAVLSATGRYTTIAAAPAKTEERRALDLLRIPPLRRLIIMSGLMVAASDLFVFYVPVFAHSVGLSASTTGVIMGAYAAAMFSTRFAMPRLVKRWHPGQILFVAMSVSGLAFLAFPFFTVVHTLMALAFVIGLGLGCGQPLSMSMTYDASPPGRTGETTGLRLTANNMARVVVPLVSGALGAAFGAAPVFWLCAVNLFAISGLVRAPKSR